MAAASGPERHSRLSIYSTVHRLFDPNTELIFNTICMQTCIDQVRYCKWPCNDRQYTDATSMEGGRHMDLCRYYNDKLPSTLDQQPLQLLCSFDSLSSVPITMGSFKTTSGSRLHRPLRQLSRTQRTRKHRMHHLLPSRTRLAVSRKVVMAMYRL